MLILLGFIPKSLNCLEAYKQFNKHYNKLFDKQKQDIFCENYLGFQSIRSECPRCIITDIYDLDFNTLRGLTPLQYEVQSKTTTCQQTYCYAPDPLPRLSEIPKSIDLRELGLVTLSKNQLQCGSCWAFGTIALLENAVLRDQKKINQQEFKKNAGTLDLSEQFTLSNTFGFSNYCEGGDTVTALNYQVDNKNIWPTIETTQNFPYDQVKYKEKHSKNESFDPKLEKSQYLLPYKLYQRTNMQNLVGTPQTPVINLMNVNQEVEIEKVQMYLARGIAVIGSIFIDPKSKMSQILASYTGKYVIQGYSCNGTGNHQILIVGYGKFKGVDVWIVKNSWGAQWGNQGHMYIERGNNQLCIEKYAYAIIPKYYDENEGVFTSSYMTPYTLKRGSSGLDDENQKSWQYYAQAGTISILVIGSIIGIIVSIIIIKQKMKARKSLYSVQQFIN
ncbi:Cathepsin L [Spironucleus salmonicida]|uniref:Cathepsin L n=1 Tax=Spironucleus salmonicida TaxID=348837 RepID=V6LX55_9EUKA|nr:Cathepsin L [Spironucleus salmonicida]|eukprot:EST48823.1 Cathepsin L [Spironucleus salmonicida]